MRGNGGFGGGNFFYSPPPSLSSSLPRPKRRRRSRRRQRASLIKDTWWRPGRPMLCRPYIRHRRSQRSAPRGSHLWGQTQSAESPLPIPLSSSHRVLGGRGGVVHRVRPRRPPGGGGGFSAPSHITHGLMSWYVTCWW